MHLAQVQGFLEVVRQGNMSRAAARLAITQPALTARLQALEQELGGPLFVRARRGVRLTETGRAFLPYAERSLAALQDGVDLVAEIVAGGAGELTIGAAPAVSSYVLPVVLARFVGLYPHVRLVVRTGHSEELVDMAARGEIQLGLVRDLRNPLVDAWPLYDDELILVANPEHGFAPSGQVPLDRLREARLILFDRASSYFDLTTGLVRQAGVLPRGTIELDNIDAAKKMVEQGLGVALLPLTAVASDLDAGRLRAIRIEGAAPLHRRIVAVRRRDADEPEGATAAFIALLSQIPELLPGARRVADAT